MSGVLLVLSFPPVHLPVFPFVSLVPLAHFIGRLPRTRIGAGSALRAGFLCGVVYYGLLLYWVPLALAPLTGLGALVFVFTVLLLAVGTGLLGWALHRVAARTTLPLWLALPILWTAMEWTQGHLGELAFPWLGLGSSLTAYPELVGIAELVGANGVTFWIALVNGLLADLIPRILERRRLWSRIAALGIVWALPPAWGIWRAKTLLLLPTATVTVLQPAVPLDAKLDPDSAGGWTRRALDELMGMGGPNAVDLVVWPETTFPAAFSESSDFVGFAHEKARRAGAPVLLGAYRLGETPSQTGRVFNSAFLVPPDGPVEFTYDKRYLVPGVERVPSVGLDLRGARLGELGGLDPGQESPVARLGVGRFGVLICFESAVPQAARSLRRAGADFLVNMTNDAWLGRGPWYTRTTAVWQHPAHLVMRAIENRVGIARSANTGISLFVDPVGRVTGRAGFSEAAERTEVLLTTEGLTFYAHAGDLLGPGCLLATLAVFLGLPMRRKAKAGESVEPKSGPIYI